MLEMSFNCYPNVIDTTKVVDQRMMKDRLVDGIVVLVSRAGGEITLSLR